LGPPGLGGFSTYPLCGFAGLAGAAAGLAWLTGLVVPALLGIGPLGVLGDPDAVGFGAGFAPAVDGVGGVAGDGAVGGVTVLACDGAG